MATQKQMYGVTEAQVLRDYREAERIYGKYMNLYIMAILSDAQHMIEYRKLKTANQVFDPKMFSFTNYPYPSSPHQTLVFMALPLDSL